MVLMYGPGYWQGSPGWNMANKSICSPPVMNNGDVCSFCGGKGKRLDPNCPPVMGWVGPNGETFPEIHCNPCGGTGVKPLAYGSPNNPNNIVLYIDVNEQPITVNDEKFEIRVDKTTGHYTVTYQRIIGLKFETHTKECDTLDEVMKFISSKA